MGMAVAILISLWVWNEVSFDRYHANYDRIAKVRQNVSINGGIETLKTVPLPLAHELRNNFSDLFEYVVSSSHRLNHVVASHDKQLTQKGAYLSAEAPDMFSLQMIAGDRTALRERHNIILSRQGANALFGEGPALGRKLTIDNHQQVTVAGVYENLPANTTLSDLAFIASFDLYISNEHWIARQQEPWTNNPVQLYVQLSGGLSFEAVSDRIRNIIKNKTGEKSAHTNAELLLEPMSKWHLYEFENGIQEDGRIQYVRMFAIIAFFVLLLACINFMNLSTARSEKRAKEVGIRKVVGSLRSHLIVQFFLESFVMVFISLLVSIILAQLFLPYFNNIYHSELTIPWSGSWFWISLILFSASTGLLAGAYPALYLSSFIPLKVLKGNIGSPKSAFIPRRALVVFQFSISVTLIICTVIVFRQIRHAKDRPPGYNPAHLVLVPMLGSDIAGHFDAFKNELLKTNVVDGIATSESTTTDIWGTDKELSWSGKDPRLHVDFPNTGVSSEYGRTVGWKFREGRDFLPDAMGDSNAFVINEAAAKYMGLEKAVGEIVRWKGKPYSIIGVINDMVVESPYEPVRPSIYCLARRNDNFAIIRLPYAADIKHALSTIERVYKKYSAATPFSFSFVSEQYQQKFLSEQIAGELARLFSILGIFISCIGLLGMAAHTTMRRQKEISIRKILGASAGSIWKLLSHEFVMLICISLVVSLPVANYMMNIWLENYTYRTDIPWWIFAVVPFGAILISLLTISVQTVKAALQNPVKNLRTE